MAGLDLTQILPFKRKTEEVRKPFKESTEATDPDEFSTELEKRQPQSFKKTHWQIDKFSESPADFVYNSNEAESLYNERKAKGLITDEPTEHID